MCDTYNDDSGDEDDVDVECVLSTVIVFNCHVPHMNAADITHIF